MQGGKYSPRFARDSFHSAPDELFEGECRSVLSAYIIVPKTEFVNTVNGIVYHKLSNDFLCVFDNF